MRKWRFTANASAVALGLLLAGCGGGGGGGPISTPPPAPTPAPVPTPTPTPTPTPAPTPPLTGVNDDLLAPLASETFDNIAAFASLSVPKSGENITTSSGGAALAISYNAADQSYTVSDGVRSRTFGAANIDPTQSGPLLTTYAVTSGNTTDFLSLTVPGTGPGQTKYVAGGYWQRQTDGSAAVDGRITAFAYGIRTPDGALPRTGVATFDVTLLGARSFQTLLYALAGEGRVDVDLQTGAVIGSGFFSERDIQSGVATTSHGWGLTALVSSAANSLSGKIEFTTFSGALALEGAFFGPGAEEIGATFRGHSGGGGSGLSHAMVGTIVGRRGSYPLNQVSKLTSPENSVFFRPVSASVSGSRDASGNLLNVAAADGILAVYQRFPSSQYVLFNKDGSVTGPSAYIAGSGPEPGYRLNQSQLTYLRAGMQIDRTALAGRLDAFAFGFDTPDAALPRTGSASFNVFLEGGVGTGGSDFRALTGSGALTADFGVGTVSTMGNYTVSDRMAVISHGPGATLDAGSWTGAAAISNSANSFAGTFAMDGATDYSGTMIGRFFGPGAEEVGAVIRASSTSGAIALATLAGARGSGAGASQTGLLDLTSTTVLQGSDAQFNTRPSVSPTQSTTLNNGIEITYDPIAKSYLFKSPGSGGPGPVPLNHALSEANRTAVGSDVTFTAYQAAGFNARLFNPGPGNPRIALTYTSFAEISEDVIHDGRETNSQHYIVFGGQTPNFQVPTTGSASYTGVVYGSGRHGLLSNEAALSGSSKFNVNFATNAATMLLDLTATDKLSGTPFALGTISFTGSLGGFCPGGCNRNTFGLNVDPVALPGGSGLMNGQFNGPNAAEFGATFKFDLPPSVPGQAASGSTFAGVTVGKKD